MLNLNDFAKEVYENAKSHGWWEGHRSFAEISALFHSEWSEALEEYRNGRPMVYHVCTGGVDYIDCDGHPDMEAGDICLQDVYKGCHYRKDKPEGIAVELIDGVIRILDWIGKEGIDIFPHTIKANTEVLSSARMNKISGAELPELVARLHCYTSNAYMEDDNEDRGDYLISAMVTVFFWLESKGVDVETVMLEKHAYNRSRPYKHGNKKC